MCRSGFLTLISCMQSKSGAFRLGIHFSVQLDTALQLMRPYRSKKSKDAAFNTQLMNYMALTNSMVVVTRIYPCARPRACVCACVCVHSSFTPLYFKPCIHSCLIDALVRCSDDLPHGAIGNVNV